jgi:hypothetical protein
MVHRGPFGPLFHSRHRHPVLSRLYPDLTEQGLVRSPSKNQHPLLRRICLSYYCLIKDFDEAVISRRYPKVRGTKGHGARSGRSQPGDRGKQILKLLSPEPEGQKNQWPEMSRESEWTIGSSLRKGMGGAGVIVQREGNYVIKHYVEKHYVQMYSYLLQGYFNSPWRQYTGSVFDLQSSGKCRRTTQWK